MDEKWKEWAKDVFGRYDFDATLLFEDEDFFIMDWKDKNGCGEYATRYIVDKQKGDLIIKGDCGDCIASWYNPVTVEKLAHYINSTGYFIGKMQCTSNKYTYDYRDVKEDLEDIKQEYIKAVRDGAFENIDEEELENIMEKYDPNWFESGFGSLGKRIDKRIYLWTYGFQEGVGRLRSRDC
jgi:hypothetical protein